MNVVIRGVQAAGMAVYASMHIMQASSPPADAPGWLAVAFAATAMIALIIAGGLILSAQRDESRWETAAALLALPSVIALAASYTTGFLGVVETDLRPATAIVAVAELMILAAYVVSRIGPPGALAEVGDGRHVDEDVDRDATSQTPVGA